MHLERQIGLLKRLRHLEQEKEAMTLQTLSINSIAAMLGSL